MDTLEDSRHVLVCLDDWSPDFGMSIGTAGYGIFLIRVEQRPVFIVIR